MLGISSKNRVLQCERKGLPWWSRLGGLSVGASQGCDKFHLLQKGHGQGTGALQLPCLVLPTQLLFPDLGSRTELGSQPLHNSALAIQNITTFSELSGVKTWSPCLPSVPNFPQQKVSPCWENPNHLCVCYSHALPGSPSAANKSVTLRLLIISVYD